MITSKKTNRKPWKYPLDTPFDDMQYRKLYLQYRLKLYNLYKQADMAGVMEASQDVPVALQDIYVPLRLDKKEISNISSSNEVDKIKGMLVEETLCRYMLVAISGMPGSGKSTLTRFIADSLSQTEVTPTVKKLGRRIVIPVVLRDLDFSEIDTLEQLWEQWVSDMSKRLELNLTWDFFWYYVSQGWAIIIFDGIDELSREKNKKLTCWINELTNEVYSHVNNSKIKFYPINIVVTGRPSGFSENENLDQFVKLHLQPFNQNEIEEYSKKWFKIRYRFDKVKIQDKTNEFIEALRRYQGLAELKHRPIYLAMLAYVAETFGELPRSRTLAYTKMVDAYIHQLELIKQLNEKKGFPEQNWSYEDKLRILEELAYTIHTQADDVNSKINHRKQAQMHIQISKKSLVEFITIILKGGRFDSMKSEDALAFSQYLLARTGLLIEPKEDFVQFSHLTFQEFLTAKRIHRRQKRTNLIKYLKEELFDKLTRTGWQEIVLLFFGIDALNAGEDQSYILRHVIERDNSNHHGFLIDLFATTDHTICDDGVLEWLKTLVYLWVTVEKPPVYLFNYLVQSLGSKHSIHKNETNNNVLQYVEEVCDRILNNKVIYDINNLIKPGEDDDKTNLASMLDSYENNIVTTNCLQNILQIGYHWNSFRHSYLNDEKIKKIPDSERNTNIAFILDKFIPSNTSHAAALSQKVFSNINISVFSQSIGRGIDNELSINTSPLHKELMKIILTTNTGFFFLCDESMELKMAVSNSMSSGNKLMKVDLDLMDFRHFIGGRWGRSLGEPWLWGMVDVSGNKNKHIIMIREYGRVLSSIVSIANFANNDKERNVDVFPNLHWFLDQTLDIIKDMSSEIDGTVDYATSKTYKMLKEIDHKVLKYVISYDNNNYVMLHDLMLSITFFAVHVASLCLAKICDIDIKYSRKCLVELYELIATDNDAINHFTKIDNTLEDSRKNEILEWLNLPASPRTMLKYIIDNSRYKEFHTDQVLIDFQASVEQFVQNIHKDAHRNVRWQTLSPTMQ